MGQDDQKGKYRDFFISYTSSDRQWAEWIAMQLEQAGYTLFIQAWDFRPGANFVIEMDQAATRAERTLLVLSPAYLESEYAYAEWSAAFRHDPTSVQRRLLPVRVQPCEIKGLLGPLVYIDLVSLGEELARERLLLGIEPGRRPATVAFPGQSIPHSHATFPGSLPTIWNIPYPRNPVFTGRENLLARLAKALEPGKAVTVAHSQTQAISGLGGIGKTQLAVEYAYQHHQEYQAVLWTRADTIEALNFGYGEIAKLLSLPEKDEQDQQLVVKAVQNWLKRQSGWLLILDNADDLTLARAFLPPSAGGHIILTTRAQSIGRMAQCIEVDMLTPEVGALLLLRRAGLVAPDASSDAASPPDMLLARAITEELGGLPLALDQAGAYIDETKCGLAGYQRVYQTRRLELLQSRRGLDQEDDHPEPVATTWSVSFERVEQHHPAAADLLRLCAFLSPDAIPEELLTEGADELGDLLAPVAADAYQLDQAIAALRAYSLLSRDPQTETLTVHRLVQTILRDALTTQKQLEWIERAVSALNIVAIDAIANVEGFERCLPHALMCTKWIEQMQITSVEALILLSLTGAYLITRMRQTEAEALLQQALAISESLKAEEGYFGITTSIYSLLATIKTSQGKYKEAEALLQQGQITPDAQEVENASSIFRLNSLANLYTNQGKHAEAEALFQQALTILNPLKTEDKYFMLPGVLNGLANLYIAQKRHIEAESVLKQALEVLEPLGTENVQLPGVLSSLSNLYINQERYTEAEPLLQQALEILEPSGTEDSQLPAVLTSLAKLYMEQKRYTEAEPLLQQALEILEPLGDEAPLHNVCLQNLAHLHFRQERYAEAEPLFQRVLAIRERILEPEHPDTTTTLFWLAHTYYGQKKYAEAEPLYQRIVAIRERALGPEHPDTATALNNLADTCYYQEKYREAEPLFQRVLATRERVLETEHPDTVASLNNMAHTYYNQEKYAEAELFYQRILAIHERALGPEHPDTTTTLFLLARACYRQEKYTDAEPLFLRVLAMRERVLGPEHLDTATALNELANTYYGQEKYEQAEPFFLRAWTTYEHVLGSEHPDTAAMLGNLADVYYAQKKYEDAEHLYQDVLAICERVLGPEHPYTVRTLNSLANTYSMQEKYAEAEPLFLRINNT